MPNRFTNFNFFNNFGSSVLYWLVVKIPEKYAEELDILRSSHNYRAFSVLAALLFGSCVIFLVQHLLVPDRYCADWVHQLYIKFYVVTLLTVPFLCYCCILSTVPAPGGRFFCSACCSVSP